MGLTIMYYHLKLKPTVTKGYKVLMQLSGGSKLNRRETS